MGAPPVYAALFGSAARGDMLADSDLDLLIVSADDVDGDAVDRAVHRLQASASRWTGNDCRVLLTTSSVVWESTSQDPLLWAVSQEGVCLAGDPQWLRRIVSTLQPVMST